MISKTAMITLAGRPNVGKSTLMNAIVGEKVSIVTNKPQTTRNRICGIVNRSNTQMVFIDTPGFHLPRTKLGDYMVKLVRESISGVDAVVLMVEPVPNIGRQEEALIAQIKKSGIAALLAVNKIDTVKKEDLLSVIDIYSKAHGFETLMPISAKTGDGIERLLTILESFAGEGHALFPEDMTSDQPEKQICAEIVREKLLLCLDKEIPHGTAVEITRFIEREDGILELDATIYCEKESHKGMIIGKNGLMLKRIGELARADLEDFMGARMFVQTWVKVRENWRDKNSFLKNFGYSE